VLPDQRRGVGEELAGHRPASGLKSATAAAFWALMQRWGVPDDQALQLIDQPPSKSGKRPRFSLSADQAERLQLLREIDQQAIDLYHRDAGNWLRRPNSSTLFGRRSPLAFMVREGRGGIEAVLRHLHKMAFGGSVAEKRRGR
jgi:uncharacterized protein (DUF2384 family)